MSLTFGFHHFHLYSRNISDQPVFSGRSTCCSCWCHWSSPMIWRWKTTGAENRLNNTASPKLLFTKGWRSEFSCRSKANSSVRSHQPVPDSRGSTHQVKVWTRFGPPGAPRGRANEERRKSAGREAGEAASSIPPPCWSSCCPQGPQTSKGPRSRKTSNS